MKQFIDLQLFAEDGDSQEDLQSEQQQEIPAELSGVDEETAREIMGMAAESTKTENPDSESVSKSTEPNADADSDTKHVGDGLEEPTQTIPYKRFKEVNDRAKASDQENKQLKEQLEQLKAQRNQPAPAANTQTAAPPIAQPVPPVQQPPQINAAFAAEVNKVAIAEAMKMTGFTQEELDVMEFADESDPKVQAWKGAIDLARTRTWHAIDQEFNKRQVEQQQLLQVHQQVIADYSSFSAEQSQAADFENVKAFAIGEKFNSLSPLEQNTLSAAWNRVERNVCSPQDVMVVKNYFIQSANEYRAKNPASQTIPQDTLTQKTEKLKLMDKHPRSSLVDGSNNAGTALTVDALERMVKEKDWDDISPDIQKLLLNGGK